MTQTEKDQLFYKVKDICEYLETRANDLIDRDIELIERDYDLTIKSFQEDPDPQETSWLSVALDAHMDTYIKTILNIICMAQTERAIEINDLKIELPDPVTYALENREEYNLT